MSSVSKPVDLPSTATSNGGSGKADATRSTPGSDVSFVTSSHDRLEGLLPGHYGEEEHGEEHEGDHHGQREVFMAPEVRYEEGRDHGGASGDGQGEKDGRAHRILLT